MSDILFIMDILSAFILGLVQGITEFLPVSSSGHLVLVGEFLKQESANALAFAAVLHVASLGAVVLYFRSDIWSLFQVGIRKLSRLPVNEKDLTLLYALLIGTIPAVIVGLSLESIIELYLQSSAVVVIALFVSSFFFMYAEWRYFVNPPQATLTVRTGLLIGCFQVLALVPGFSRSGATIAGGMILGLTRVAAARFAFLLSIPVIAGAGLLKMIDLIAIRETVSWLPIIVGSITSFVTALFVIHFFMTFIGRHTLWPFIWYKLLLAVAVGYVAFIL